MGLAEILAVVLPAVMEKVIAIHRAHEEGKLSADDVKREMEKLRDAIAGTKSHDADIDNRINEIK